MPVLTRAVWKSPIEFMRHYDLKKSHAYRLIAMPDFPKKRIGEKVIRVDMSKTDEFMDTHFNR